MLRTVQLVVQRVVRQQAAGSSIVVDFLVNENTASELHSFL